MLAKKNPRPRQIERELHGEDRKGPGTCARRRSKPDTPKRDRHQCVEQGPRRREDPVGRRDGRPPQSSIPAGNFASRPCTTDARDGKAKHKREKQAYQAHVVHRQGSIMHCNAPACLFIDPAPGCYRSGQPRQGRLRHPNRAPETRRAGAPLALEPGDGVCALSAEFRSRLRTAQCADAAPKTERNPGRIHCNEIRRCRWCFCKRPSPFDLIPARC